MEVEEEFERVPIPASGRRRAAHRRLLAAYRRPANARRGGAGGTLLPRGAGAPGPRRRQRDRGCEAARARGARGGAAARADDPAAAGRRHDLLRPGRAGRRGDPVGVDPGGRGHFPPPGPKDRAVSGEASGSLQPPRTGHPRFGAAAHCRARGGPGRPAHHLGGRPRRGRRSPPVAVEPLGRRGAPDRRVRSRSQARGRGRRRRSDRHRDPRLRGNPRRRGAGSRRGHGNGAGDRDGPDRQVPADDPIEKSPLQRDVGRIVRRLAVAGLAVCALVVVFLLPIPRETARWPARRPRAGHGAPARGVSRRPDRLPGSWRLADLPPAGPDPAHPRDRDARRRDRALRRQDRHAHRRTAWRCRALCGGRGAQQSRRLDAAALPEDFRELVEFAILASQRTPFDPMERAIREFGLRTLPGTEHLHEDW